MNSYELTRSFFDWCFENPDKVTPNHVAVYCFSVEHCNRLGWKKNFGLPTTMVMEAVGIKSYNTYIKTFNDLVKFGFIILVEKSRNQYSANIIALSKFNKALDKALDKALIKHGTKQLPKQSESTIQSNDSIDKQYNKEPINQLTINNVLEEKSKRFIPPTYKEVQEYCLERKNKVDPQKFVDFYTSKNWMVGKSKMKDWKASVRTWEGNQQNNNNNGNTTETKSNDLGAQADRIARGIFGSDSFGFTTGSNESTEDIDYESVNG